MKKFLLIAVLFAAPFAVCQQDDEMVSVPKSKLTEQQKADLKVGAARNWVGMGKEIGEAVNSSMAAVTTQSNTFAQTPVGKLTVLIVIWKVIGDQALHVFGGLIELVLCVPIWLWSYRRMCMTRRLRTGKETWQVIAYDPDKYGEMKPRVVHALFALFIMGAFFVTVFSY